MSKEKNILVVMPVNEKHKGQILEAAIGENVIFASSKDISDATLADMDIIIGNIETSRLKDARSLKWLQLNSAGSDTYARKGIMQEGALLTNATGAYGLAISEHMIGMLLELIKKLNLYRDNQKKSLWKDEGQIKSIYGSTILIVGLGDIGGEFAKKVKALGAYTIGIRRKNSVKPDYLDELYLADELDKVLPRADIVALSLPATKDTSKLFSRERFAIMKEGAVLLNVGRGSAVDSDALYDAITAGHLYGAAIDVTDPEPLPADHKLWKLDNMVITPHISGDFHLQETHDRIVRIACENLRAYLKGGKLKNQVDFNTGYRKTEIK